MIRILVVFFFFLTSFTLGQNKPPAPFVNWTMVNVNAGHLQGDAHVLEFPGKKFYLIDACNNDGALLKFIQEKGIRRFEKVLISHLHRDHYLGFWELLAAGIQIDEVRLNFPVKSTCDGEKPWGCDWDEVQKLRKTLTDHRIPFRNYQNGEVLLKMGSIKLEVLANYDGIDTPIGPTDVNDMSSILRLTNGKIRVLFTGDLNRKLGEWLSAEPIDLKADILKVPHHGTESTAPNSFFDAVQPKTALVPSPTHLWFSQRSSRIRTYFQEKGTKVYVNGLSGNIRASIGSRSYTIDPEFQKPLQSLHAFKD